MDNLKELREINDIEIYLNKIQEIKDECYIFFVVKDTPGNCMPTDILNKIHDLGFISFSNELWRMYIGVRQSGHIIIDYVAGECEEPLNRKIQSKESTNIIELYSESWRNGNKCGVRINGIECSLNKRGINLVIYDDKCESVIDAIRFDSHDKNFIFERKPEVELLSNKIRWLSEKHHYDVCVTGVWYGANYGSILNGYSTYKILSSMGKSVLMLHKTKSPVHDAELRLDNHNVKFYNTYYPKDSISPVFTYEELEILNDYCDCFCSGSDQIWNYNVSFDGNMYLPFVHENRWKISLASSFGSLNDHVPQKEEANVKKYFERFDAISVREEFDKQLLWNKYGVDSTVVIDPVFCLDKKEYTELIRDSQFSEENFILAYILDPSNEKLEFLKQAGHCLNKQIITICDGAFDVINSSWSRYEKVNEFPNIRKRTEVVDFLKAFSTADFVITDSFHGTAFSLIFKKRFISICNAKRGKERFYDLLGRFNLLDRLIDTTQLLWNANFGYEIDYKTVDQIIEEEKKKTLIWLSEALVVSKMRIKGETTKNMQASVERLQHNRDFKNIRILVTLLRDYGIKHVVLSPGGRDVPLIRMFENNADQFILHSVTDERSAAYYGMGIATQLRQPVVCVCTSGTAASNFLPAVTEAYYTGIPLILVTADRYGVYLNHGEDQTIPQKHIYSDVVKMEVSLPESDGWRSDYQARRDVASCILESTHNGLGPVHINVPVDNISIGADIPRDYWSLLPFIYPHILRVSFNNGQTDMKRWADSLRKSNKILIVYGQNVMPNEKQKNNIQKFASKYNCVIVTDRISNLHGKYTLMPHNMLQSISQDTFNKELSPDILITVGGKRLMNDPLTFKVRRGSGSIRHWQVTPNGKIKDFYFRLTSIIESTEDYFFEWFADNAGDIVNNGVYYEKWRSLNEKYSSPEITRFNSLYIQSKFLPAIPKGSILHLGVGQSFLECRRFKIDDSVEVYCNMGTNGIDGCTSTFMGQCAVVDDKLCFLLVGDLSFFYDMNSIWNKPLKKNMRILLVNNNGTGLLRGHNLSAVSSVHNTSAEGWVKSTGFDYISAHTKEEYKQKLKYFLSNESEKALFFEVFCE